MSTATQVYEIVLMNLKSIPQRLGASLVIVIGIAGVVGVLVAMLSMSTGLNKTLTATGDPNRAIILRGGSNGPNYDSVHVAVCERELEKAGIAPNIVVDCSHANSNKDHALQALVLDNVANQILEGNRSIVGAMLESNLEAGNQPIPADLSKLRYGVSVTDACMDWASTEQAIRSMHEKLRHILPERCGAIGS